MLYKPLILILDETLPRPPKHITSLSKISNLTCEPLYQKHMHGHAHIIQIHIKNSFREWSFNRPAGQIAAHVGMNFDHLSALGTV